MKNEILTAVLFALLVTTALSTVFIIHTGSPTGFSTAEFDVGVEVIHAQLLEDQSIALNAVIVSGSDVGICIPIVYYGTATINLSLSKPQNYSCSNAWSVNESNTIKPVTANSANLSWVANKTSPNATLCFVAPAAFLSEEITSLGSNYQKQLTVASCAHLLNASITLNVSTAYTNYTLYLIEGSTSLDRTLQYRLEVINGVATFSNFDLSNKTFRITGSPPTVGRGRGGGSGGGRGPYFTPGESQRPDGVGSNNSSNGEFIVTPQQFTITLQSPGNYSKTLRIENFENQSLHVQVAASEGIIISPDIELAPRGMLELVFNSTFPQPGKYVRNITFTSAKTTQIVSLNAVVKPRQPSYLENALLQSPSAQVLAGNLPPLVDILLGLLAVTLVLAGFIYFFNARKYRK